MTVGSLFAGIGGFDLGFERAGARTVWQVEIDRPCRRVLARHFPESERNKDVRQATAETLGTVDLICGGFPCQDVSIAGRRKGMAGERSGLWWEFHRILGELRTRWVVIENVPGLLSVDEGRGFASILHGLGKLGYRSAWRVLDAQHYGLAQRRKRLFIVGHLADGSAAEVLFERTGLQGHPAPGRKAGKDIAFAITSSVRKSGDGHGNAWNTTYPIAGTLGSRSPNGGSRTSDLDGHGAYVAACLNARDSKGADSDTKPGHLIPVAGTLRQNFRNNSDPASEAAMHVLAPMLRVGGRDQGAGDSYDNTPTVGVRRLTPVECERLQGFPDGWTEGHADTQRYRMLGNAVAVPVAEWIARRIINAEGPCSGR